MQKCFVLENFKGWLPSKNDWHRLKLLKFREVIHF